MNSDPPSRSFVVGVGAVVWSSRGEVLLIRRANPPRQSEWSLPGGKVEVGETLRAAVTREVREETGLEIENLDMIDVAELLPDAGAVQTHFVLIDFAARAVADDAMAGSDALEARWFRLAELEPLPLWSETRRVIGLSARRLGIS